MLVFFAMVNQLSVIGLTKRPWRTDNCLTEKDFGQEGVHDGARFFSLLKMTLGLIAN